MDAFGHSRAGDVTRDLRCGFTLMSGNWVWPRTEKPPALLQPLQSVTLVLLPAPLVEPLEGAVRFELSEQFRKELRMLRLGNLRKRLTPKGRTRESGFRRYLQCVPDFDGCWQNGIVSFRCSLQRVNGEKAFGDENQRQATSRESIQRAKASALSKRSFP